MNSRRNFLQKLTASVIALPLLSKQNYFESIKDINDRPYDGPMLRVAIMGLGSYGTRVADAMQSCTKAKFVGVISGTPSKITAWQAKYNIPEKNCYNYENFDNIKDNPDIDAVYVITPNALHKDGAIRVAKAGKHVICEKPMSVNAKEGEQMIAACKKANVKLLVGYRMHFEPKTLEVIRMRKEGEFGKILFFQGLSGFRIGDPTQWRLKKELAGGGSMMDIGIYSINGARYMIGEEPIWVTAQETKTDFEKFKEVEQSLTWQFEFPNGLIGEGKTSYADNMNFLKAEADKGVFELTSAYNYTGQKGNTPEGSMDFPLVNQQAKQMDAFAMTIKNNKQSIVPGEMGRRDVKYLQAVYEAMRTGKRVLIK